MEPVNDDALASVLKKSSLLSMNNYLIVVSAYCVGLLENSESDSDSDLNKHRVDVLNFENNIDLKKVVDNFEKDLNSLLRLVFSEYSSLQSLFKRLENATNVSEEVIDNEIYLYLQSAGGSCFVHVRDPSTNLELLKAYFYLYHFKSYTELHFVQLTKFGDKNDAELSSTIWATMTISNWKVYSNHVRVCLDCLNKILWTRN